MEPTPHTSGEKEKLRFFDTFAGVGGFALPLTELGHECVGFSEIDGPAISVYQHHFPTHKNYGDITTIATEHLPDFDLLVGGFPCQSFSVAGKRGGFADTRGTLFFEICRIVRAKRPRYLLLENVKGLLSHEGGRTYLTIKDSLAELGYDSERETLNSKHFGVPQNRERVFIVGHLRGTPRPEVFPLGEDEGEAAGDDRRGIEYLNDAPNIEHVGQDERVFSAGGVSPPLSTGNNIGKVAIGRWVNKESGVALDETAPALRASGGTDIRKRPVVLQQPRGDEADGVVEVTEGVPQSLRVYSPEGIAPTLFGNDYGGGKTPKILQVGGSPTVLDVSYGNRPPRVSEDVPTLRANSQGGGYHAPVVLAMNQQREVRAMDVAGALQTSQSSTQFQAVAVRGRGEGAVLEARPDDVANALRTASGGSSKPLVMYPGHAINEPDGVARTLKAGVHGVPGGEGLVRDDLAIRRLTPVECERLQSFPDDWTKWGVERKPNTSEIGGPPHKDCLRLISDTQRYKMLGNAVTVNVVREIVRRLA